MRGKKRSQRKERIDKINLSYASNCKHPEKNISVTL